MSRLAVTAINKDHDTPRKFTVTGQEAKALLALKEAGPKGCTAQEVAKNPTVQGQTAKLLLALIDAGEKAVTAQKVPTWALRFAAYCHDLKHKFGLSIRTDREGHEGGWHGRYVLETPVEIIEVKRPSNDNGGANG